MGRRRSPQRHRIRQVRLADSSVTTFQKYIATPEMDPIELGDACPAKYRIVAFLPPANSSALTSDEVAVLGIGPFTRNFTGYGCGLIKCSRLRRRRE